MFMFTGTCPPKISENGTHPKTLRCGWGGVKWDITVHWHWQLKIMHTLGWANIFPCAHVHAIFRKGSACTCDPKSACT